MSGPTGRPSMPMMAPWSATVALLVLLSAAPSQARTGHMMPPWMHEGSTRFGRGLTAAGGGSVSGVTAPTTGTSCPAPTSTVVYRTPLKVPPSKDPPPGTVAWNTLNSTYGWDLPSNRPSLSTYNLNNANGGVTGRSDFWSVACNNWGKVAVDRVSCTDSAALRGVLHMRYKCDRSGSWGTFWMLLYTLTEFKIDPAENNNWASYCDQGCDGGGDQGDKFVQWSATSTTGCQNGACSTTCGADCPWCCSSMWLPVTDTVNGLQQNVGWLARTQFALPPGANASYSGFFAHFDADVISGGVPTQTTTPSGSTSSYLCLTCSPENSPGCVSTSIIMDDTPETSFCTSEQRKLFNFTATITHTFAPTPTATSTPTGGAATSCDVAVVKNVTDGAGVNDIVTYQVACNMPSTTTTIKLALSLPATGTDDSGCGAKDEYKTLIATANQQPNVTVTAPSNTFVCAEDTSFVPGSFVLSTDVQGGKVNATITVATKDPLQAAAAPTCLFKTTAGDLTSLELASPGTYSVNCSKGTGGLWPAAGFTVTVTAKGGTPGCDDTDSKTVGVEITPKPVVSVTGPNSIPICSNATSFELKYNVTVAPGQTVTFGINDTDKCRTISPASPQTSGPDGLLVTVTCSAAAWPEGSFGLLFYANAGTGDCTGQGDKITSVTVNKLPTVQVDGPETKSVCSEDDDLTLDYTVTLTNLIAAAVTLSPSWCKLHGEPVTATTTVGSGLHTVTCAKSDNTDNGGKWPASPFSVTLYASGGDQATNCVDGGADSTTVTLRPKPTINAQVVAPDNMCDNTTVIQFTYNVTIDQLDANGNPLPFTWSINDTDTCSEDFGSDIAGPGGVLVRVTCTKNSPDKFSAATGFGLLFNASTGTGACSDDKQVTNFVSVSPKPTVSINGDAPKEVCAEDPSLTFTYTVDSGTSNLPVAVTTPSGCDTTYPGLSQAQPCVTGCVVPSGTPLTITCTKPDNGWTSFGTARRRLLAPIQDLWEFDLGDSHTEEFGVTPPLVASATPRSLIASTPPTFDLTVTAYAGTTGCDDRNSKPATVTVIPKANIGIDVSPDQKICSNATDEQLVFDVTLTGDDVPVNVSLTTHYAGCKLYSDIETAGANHIDFARQSQNVRVRCDKGNGWSDAIGTNTFSVNGTAGSGNCANDGSDSASFTVFKKPELILTPAGATTLCAKDNSLDLVYTLSGTPPNATLSVSTSAGSCIITDEAGSGVSVSDVSNGDVTITCTNPGQTWQTGPFTVTVSAQSESGLVGCNDVEVNDTSVNVYPPTDLTLTDAQDLFICSDSDADQDFNFTVTTTAPVGTDPPPANVSLGEATNGGVALSYCQFVTDGQPAAGPLTFVPSGTVVTVRCTNGDSALSWAGVTGSLSFSVTASAGAGRCADTDTQTATLNIVPKRTVSLTPPDNQTICALEDSVSFTFTLQASADADITVSPRGCTATPTFYGSGNIVVTCPKRNGWSQYITGTGNSFEVTVTATIPSAERTNAPTCGATDSKVVKVSVTSKSSVQMNSATPLNICAAKTTALTVFTYTATDTAGKAIDITVNDTSSCSVTPNKDPTTANQFTVTCTQAAWASGSFSLLVNASTGNGDCDDFKTDIVHVEAYPVPNITLTADSSVAVCTESLSLTVNYTVTADPGRNLPYELAYPDTCSITIPPGLEATAVAASGTKQCEMPSVGLTGTQLVQLTCSRADKTVPWTTPMVVAGKITETASIVSATDCTDTATASTTISNTDKITVNIVPQGSSSVCTTASSASFTYNITRTPAGAAPTVTTSSTGCSVTGPTSGTIYTVSCDLPSGGWNGFKVDVSATTGSGPCDGQRLDTRTLSGTCCSSGSAYLNGNGTLDSSATALSQCFNCSGPNNWGWFNRLSGAGSATFTIYAGASSGNGKACENLSKKVGKMLISCKDIGASGADFAFGQPDYALNWNGATSLADAGLDQHYYVGCDFYVNPPVVTTTYRPKNKPAYTVNGTVTSASPLCNPPAYGAPASVGTLTNGVWTCPADYQTYSRCGGNAAGVLVPTGGTNKILLQGCTCKNLVYVFHVSPKGPATWAFSPTPAGTC